MTDQLGICFVPADPAQCGHMHTIPQRGGHRHCLDCDMQVCAECDHILASDEGPLCDWCTNEEWRQTP